METEPSALLERTLVIVAHPDDDVLGCGILLQRMREPLVVFCTDGAPRAQEFWAPFGCRERYAELRRCEARSALATIGIELPIFLSESEDRCCFTDQDLFLAVPNALSRILAVIDEYQPSALLTHAYEGGHPDHDACSFVAHLAGRQRELPVWEFPLYNLNELGQFRRQQFLCLNDREVFVSPSPRELERKQHMVAQHASQQKVLEQFSPELECFRLTPAYNFSIPPHDGTLNYEAWGWPMTGKQLCAAFQCCLHRHSLLPSPLSPRPPMAA